MNQDEQAIRDLIALWQRVSKTGDVDTLRTLMAEDVVFLVPGHSPMRGRETFLAAFKGFSGQVQFESKSEIQEIQVAGDWAYCWTHLTVEMTPPAATSPIRRAGYTLSIFRKEPGGNWVIARDANLLTVQNGP